MQPSARSSASSHSARRDSKKVGAGMRQSCRCCSLIHCFSRTNHCSASDNGGEFVKSFTTLDSVATSEATGTDLGELAKCQCSRPLLAYPAFRQSSIALSQLHTRVGPQPARITS